MSGTETVPVLARAVRLAEAMLFASAEPVRERALLDLLQSQDALPDGEDVSAALGAVLAALQASCADRAVQPVQVAGGWQFRTVPELAPALTKVMHRPRRLPRAAMETLAIIAYHQPCTRTEIEEIRGVSLGQATLDGLLEASLIVPRGRKEVPGRPVLWGTSPAFLSHFGLRDLRDLPRREELLVELPSVATPADAAGTDAGQPVSAEREAC
ncbi:SMC-Scp complex subunit ScpB [Lichenicoccus roseus]|uniref:SMC-Scp complex subunit ScpB n=1 Tax=Lichenicoccus roseus TaxID=2683649 RepID=A0A5R9JDU6_9PROT|nr:SMC-Scp complex subunit ScpB [Lichenicoccus roseus]TLU72468.1 SMC-Scp complex subunit ScpB [Lichenicoccus roseus]